MAPGSALLLWIIVLAIAVGLLCALLMRLIRRDTTNFDLEFLWDNRFSRDQLELEDKK